MLPMSSPNINPGAGETQQMRIMAPVGVRSFLIHIGPQKLMGFFIVVSDSATAADFVHCERKCDPGPSRLL